MNYLDIMVRELFEDVLNGKKNIPVIQKDKNETTYLIFTPKVKIYRNHSSSIHVIVEDNDYKLLRDEYITLSQNASEYISKIINKSNENHKGYDIPKEIIELDTLFDKVLIFSKSRQNDFIEKKIILEAFSEIK